MPDYQKLRQEAIALREQGFSMRQIGQRLGLQSGTITRWVKHVPFSGFNETTRTAQSEAYRDLALYQQAIDLRKQGYSYRLITEATGVSKSTLSGWLKNVSFAEHHPEVRERMENAVQAMGRAQRTKAAHLKSEAEAEAAEEMATLLAGELSLRELFISGLMLYWGEGTKTHYSIGITNSDPNIIKTFIIWLKLFLNATPENLRVAVNVYPDTDIETAEAYWENVTAIPRSQFHKTQIDRRTGKLSSKQGKLEFGTVHVRLMGKGTGYLKHKVLKWIEVVADRITTMRV